MLDHVECKHKECGETGKVTEAGFILEHKAFFQSLFYLHTF